MLNHYSQKINLQYVATGMVIFLIVLMTGAFDKLVSITGFEPDFNLRLWAYSAVYLLGTVVVCLKFDRNWFYREIKTNTVLLMMLLFAAASLLWSIDPASSAKRILHLYGIFWIALFLGSALSLKGIGRAFTAGFSTVVILSFIFSIVSPEMSFTERYALNNPLSDEPGALVGLAFDKNTMGFTAVMAILSTLAYLYLASKRKKRLLIYTPLFCVFFYVLIRSNSATSVIVLGSAAVYAALLILFRKYKFSPGLALALLSITLLVGSIISLLFELKFEISQITQFFGRSGTFTGRIELWENAWFVSQLEPWRGHGYGTIWSPIGEFSTHIHHAYIRLDYGGPIVHAHNGFLQLSTTLGIPFAVFCGAFLVFINLRSAADYLQKRKDRYLIMAVVSLLMIMHNITEASFLESRNLVWCFFLLPYFNVGRSRAAEAEAQTKNQKEKPQRSFVRNRVVAGFSISGEQKIVLNRKIKTKKTTYKEARYITG